MTIHLLMQMCTVALTHSGRRIELSCSERSCCGRPSDASDQHVRTLVAITEDRPVESNLSEYPCAAAVAAWVYMIAVGKDRPLHLPCPSSVMSDLEGRANFAADFPSALRRRPFQCWIVGETPQNHDRYHTSASFCGLHE